MTLQIGRLRHRIAHQRYTTSRSNSGQEAKSWTTNETRWASIEPLQGRELEVAKQVHAQATHKITVRYLDGLAPKDRFLFGTREFNVLDVVNVEERNEYHVCTCVERVDG